MKSNEGVHGIKIEQGIFNPVIYGGDGGNPDITRTVAEYMKINNLLFFTIYFETGTR